jgi:dolichol-phosphate mannosyltransferase
LSAPTADRRHPLLVVVPAYNEAETIAELISRSLPHADVCIVDDCSTDDTAAIAEAVPGVCVIRHSRNTHIAGALLDGFRHARDRGYEDCITMDAGLSHDPDVIPDFHARHGADLVIGARSERIDAPWYRHALSFGARTLTNLALERRFVPWGGAGLGDTTSGYRMYSRRAYELLLEAPLRSRSFDFHLESLAYVYRAGLRIEEIPVSYQFSNSSLQPGIVAEALKTCGRLWVDDFRV